MEGTDIDYPDMLTKLNEVYHEAMQMRDFGSALQAIHGLMEIQEQRASNAPFGKGVGFGNSN